MNDGQGRAAKFAWQGSRAAAVLLLAAAGAILGLVLLAAAQSNESALSLPRPSGTTSGRPRSSGTLPGYDIVYVRQPRYGDETNTVWPEVTRPARAEPGADLMLLHPNGSEEVLVRGGYGSVTDPTMSLDGEWVYYSYFPDLRPESMTDKHRPLPKRGADIYRIHLGTRQIERLTYGEFTPNTGAGVWNLGNPVDPPPQYDALGYGIVNLGPCPLPGGRIAFTSNRNGFEPPKEWTTPTLQLFVMDQDGSNVTQIGHLNVSSALHPTLLQDGRIMFSSQEDQGLRSVRLWGIWAIWPDGREWTPILSAFEHAHAFHFMTQMPDGDIVAEDYYNQNNNGFGTLYRFPLHPPPGVPRFHSAFPEDNPPIEYTTSGRSENEVGELRTFQMPFTPWGLESITPMTHQFDHAAPVGADGLRVGKFTHPSAAPGGDLLVIRTPGPANRKDRPISIPYYDGGIYLLPANTKAYSPDDLVLIKNDPKYNAAWARAAVPYVAVHGVEPVELPWLPNDGSVHAELPAGTPFGLIGSSSVYRRESFPGVGEPSYDGLDAFNHSGGDSTNWKVQGAEAGKYSNSEIWALRIVTLTPHSDREEGPHRGKHFYNYAQERMRILGGIPLRKFDSQGNPILDPTGDPDTSFLAKIPADTPFLFQTIDRNGMVLNMAQTWHQVRPGEMRVNCGGCHAHSQTPLPFDQTFASTDAYEIVDLTQNTPLITRSAGGDMGVELVPSHVVDIEFYRDILPILERSCMSCHSGPEASAPGRFTLEEDSTKDGPGPIDLPGTYWRLAFDNEGDSGYPPLIGQWAFPNASRYIRKLQSRRSLLIWKLFGERLDGWTNADHPTETVPGDAGTLPAGADPKLADIDFNGQVCPPPGSGAPPLSQAEKMMIARWIDLGAPIDLSRLHGNRGYGWFLDALRPTLTVSLPRARGNPSPLDVIRIGAYDLYSGLDEMSFSVTADVPVAGAPPGTELAGNLVSAGDHIWELQLSPPLTDVERALLTVSVRDHEGNVSRVRRSFSVP